MAPAIVLAREGFIVDAALAETLNLTLADAREFAEFHRVFGKPGGGLWLAGDRMTQPDLARTLQLLSDSGPDAFYQGAIAGVIVSEMKRGNGLITAGDLAGYQAVERQALTTRYRGKYDVHVPPLASSGGSVLLEELNVLENFDLKSFGRWSPKTIHIMAETMRRANYDRARYLGDSAFVQIPAKLTTHEYGRQLAKTIDVNKATLSKELNAEIPLTPEGESTTQFSVIDRNGMAVANTYTLERRWGSRIVVKDMGFLLNNDMRAFNLFPGHTDIKGMIGTAPNTIAPGKRPISSMTPTIVTKDGRVLLVTGSPGSRAIPHTVLNILVSVLDFQMPLKDAVAAPRFSQEWFPDQISFERPERSPEIVKALNELGHTIVAPKLPLPFQGDAHSIHVIAPNNYIGVADHRISGKAAGY